MSEMRVKDLAVKTREVMRASGTAEYSLWKQYTQNLLAVVRWFRKHGHEMFSEEVAGLYLDELTERYNRGDFKRDYYLFMRRGVTRMMEVFGCSVSSAYPGGPEPNFPKRGSRYQFNDYYGKLLAEFSVSGNFHPNTLGDIVWVVRKFFAWLCEEGHPDLTNVGADEIQRFVIDCSNAMKINSVYNVKLYLKKLCVYLNSTGLLPNSFEKLLSFHVSRQSRLLPTTPPEEIEAVLSCIDRDTSKGKRDYAMFILIIVAGLRAVDIIRLKLTDIDWRRGEITIVQSKTTQNLQMPLTTDVGEALQEYILNGRPRSFAPQVFLWCKPPYYSFAAADSIGDVYDEYRRIAGYERKAFDGKGVHSLRRTAGTNFVTSGISLTDAAQMLGKIRPESMKKYIALDAPHLKECALSFADIEMGVTV